VAFELDGQTFTGLNGGPLFQFSEAISFQVNCETQDEVDHYWNQLSRGGPPERSNAAGSRTSSGYRGKSCRPS
jgi:predicted 3-demethylubiquinone-9 3-methyltransferase (glyoxalase superfamily)